MIKCMRPDSTSAEWRAIQTIALRDERIIILDMTLSKSEVIELYSCCDCYVSLHRAEGFGRGIAEALALELEVIATNYGGNVEFCEMAGAKLIPYKLIPVGADNYIEWDGNFWAEPDIEAATVAMKSVHTNVTTVDENFDITDRRLQLHKLFSPAAVGERYQAYFQSMARLL